MKGLKGMLDLFDKIRNSAFEQVFWIVVGMISQKVLEKSYKILKRKIRNRAQRKRIKKYNILEDNYLNTLTIGSGTPNYSSDDIIFKDTGKKLFISFPKELISELDADMRNSFKKEDISFDNTNNFNEIIEETNIGNLQELIDKYRIKVAKDFIDDKNGCYFNGKKYGVYSLKPFCRTEDLKEDPKVKINLYQTDYFTHKVFREIYKEISSTICNITIDELYKYRAFTTSFAANILIITNEPERRILLTKRSPFVTESHNSRYNIT